MRKFILISTLILITCGLQAQQCDIAQTGVKIFNATNTDPVTSIYTGQTANFNFTIQNSKNDANCAVPANTVTAVFDFPTAAGGIKPYVYAGATSFVSDYFTWTYNAAADVLIGINNRIIPAGSTDVLRVRVRGNTAGAGNSNLNITQGKGISDFAGNNYSGARLVVNGAGVPMIKLTSFTVKPASCDIILNWNTLTEYGLNRFEVEYSNDGFSFIKIGSVNAKNNINGSDYEFKCTPPAEKGFYRLRQVDNNDKSAYSDDVYASTGCGFKGKIALYPNPVNSNQKLIVNISGYSGKIKADLFDGLGKKIKEYNLSANVNQLSVSNLAGGTYTLYVKDEDGGVQAFKVIVIH